MVGFCRAADLAIVSVSSSAVSAWIWRWMAAGFRSLYVLAIAFFCVSEIDTWIVA